MFRISAWCLIGAVAASTVLAVLYARFGRSLANRHAFAANFVPITVTTMFIITIIELFGI